MVPSRICSFVLKSRHAFRLISSRKMNNSIFNSDRLSNRKSTFDIKRPVADMSANFETDLNDPKRHLNYDQLLVRKDKNHAIVIDVREHSEINETGKIPESIHIPLKELKKALGEMSQAEFRQQYKADQPCRDAEIIFSCKSGNRSMQALKIGLELGFCNAKNYKGGWMDWAEKCKN